MAEFYDGDTTWEMKAVGERLIASSPSNVFNKIWKCIERIPRLRTKRVSQTDEYPFSIFCRDSAGFHTCRIGFRIWPQEGKIMTETNRCLVKGYSCDHYKEIVAEILDYLEDTSGRTRITVE
ncbi:MAG TPA: hypothetical protein EYP58_01920 [bacterium (Candidatus Stahlbacteria)]|nr:hypothetical protein [Candidatus Stahlbacteria bacterium]